MLRAVLTVYVLLLASCAHERSNDSKDPAVIAVTQFLIEAVSPVESEAYGWDAFARRVSTSMEWRSTGAGAEDGVEVRREGRTIGRGGGQEIIALGDSTQIRTLSIDANAFTHAALLESLRGAGATVEFQGDFESYTEYVFTPSGRDVAVLTTNSTCIPFDPQPGEVCRNYVTLAFNPW
jgi:hypothetical protein